MYLKSGWPSQKRDIPVHLQPYWSIRTDLYDLNGIIMKEDQIVIPPPWIDDTLSKLHVGHFGIVKTKKRARQTVYWPNMSKDIERICSRCETCLSNRTANKKEPMFLRDVPSRPYEMIASDILNYDFRKPELDQR